MVGGKLVEVVGVGLDVPGNCKAFHDGCEPLTMLVCGVGVAFLVPPDPPEPLLVAVGVSNEVLLASMVGVLVMAQVGAPSDVRA